MSWNFYLNENMKTVSLKNIFDYIPLAPLHYPIKDSIGLHYPWQVEHKKGKMDTLRVCINKGAIILDMKKRHAEQISVFKWIVLWCKLVHSALMKWIL